MSQSTKVRPEPQVESNPNQRQTEVEAEVEEEEDDEHSVEVEQQMVFDDAGGLKPDGKSVESSLESFGAEVDHQDRPTRIEEPAASEFGVDDRTEVTGAGESDQHSLFSDVKNDQQTLGGDSATNQCLFESPSETNDKPDPEEEE